MMGCDIPQKALQSPELDRTVIGNDFMMFSMLLRGDAQM